MAKVERFEDLIAWQKGMVLVEKVYGLSRQLPADERFGLVSQMRRAAVSIPANVSEGFGRSGRQDFLRFLDMALGSANELETELILCGRLGFIKQPDYADCIDILKETQLVIKGLISSLQRISGTGVRK